MAVIAVLLVVVGLAALISTLRSALHICSLSSEWGWRVLFGLILGFCASYGAFALHLVFAMHTTLVEFALSAILFFGGLFVLLVIKLSKRSLKREKQQTAVEKQLAEQDSLTNLPNRASFLKQVKHRLDSSEPFAILLIDLNNFKEINDALGHFVGDQLLQQLAQRLTQALLPQNKLYRIGGDEFVLFSMHPDSELLYAQNNALVSTLHSPFTVEDYDLYVTYSAGASQFLGEKRSSTDLLKEADIAMYRAKQTQQSLVIFSEDLGGAAKRELETLQRMQHALTKNEFVLHYQPIHDYHSGQIVALEALLRWPQADGTIMPAELFMKSAMRSGVLRQITPWVLRRIHSELPTLLEAQPSLKIHVNLCAYDLQSNKIVHHLAEHQTADRTFSRHVVLEIADGILINQPQSEELVKTLHELGYQINIDDFATGNGGIRHLVGEGLSSIKLDPIVFKEMSESDKTKLLELSALLAKSLNVKLVAKGIEKQEQVELFNALGVDLMQGFHICEPMSLNNCVSWLESQSVVNRAIRASR
ncbi:diguanylate cyclase/phosphodiesterase (GGDEF & EAL domains) with PAS/PAC sensor(s) [Pseudoalteromonas luteoviolacea B = ATCC 29581]|nr:diguanylate cyclase/phosphodiesterase (GGDEF & EAL domains) with PAS/PAC sensor(s) [Pseudoalteromonas luteoviolacea B = ATCC 29581]